MSTPLAERQEVSVSGLLAEFEPTGTDDPGTEELFCGPICLVVQAPDIRNDYKKASGSSDGAKTYDTTAT